MQMRRARRRTRKNDEKTSDMGVEGGQMKKRGKRKKKR
jgi:hypothetical protein